MMFALGCGFRVGYGASELGSGNIVNPFDVRGSVPGTVGGPMPNTEVRLEPLPDYDDPLCGEIIAGGQMLCSGYLYDDEQTAKLFVDESRTWVRTGDIGKWDENNYLKIVDRIRSVFKLAQGEYVAAEMVTQAYDGVPTIEQLYVYGDSGRVCLIAVIIPRRAEVAKILGKAELSDDEFKAACTNRVVKDAILAAMNEAAKARGLFGFQQVKAIHLDTKVWTADNNLLTPTFKVRRKALADYYRQDIDALYDEYAAQNPPH
jgi:long-chain acyl-CoA synthetase